MPARGAIYEGASEKRTRISGVRLLDNVNVTIALTPEEHAHVRAWRERRGLTFTQAVRLVDHRLREADPNLPRNCTTLRMALLVASHHAPTRAYILALSELRA